MIAAVLQPGFHRPSWDGRDDQGRITPPGVYLGRLTTPQGAFTRRVIRMR